jgi:thymidylate synthase (FAD)
VKVILPEVKMIYPLSKDQCREILENIEQASRVCYKSESNSEKLYDYLKDKIERGHESVIEHSMVTFRIICDRGVSHELVRHRIASYSQESTRYCNYGKDKFGKELTFIKPCFWEEDSDEYVAWHDLCRASELTYLTLLNYGTTPQEARSVLPNSLKTEIVVTMNLREWRHFLKLRLSKAAHPQMREIAFMVFKNLKYNFGPIFFDLEE